MSPDPAPSDNDVSRPTALIIDDEPTIRSALRRYFTRKGWTVEEASEGSSGLRLLNDRGAEFSLVVCDLRMPGFSGVELHDQLEASDPALLRRFIFTTGDVSSPDASGFVSRTSCEVLQKPFELRALDAIISRVAGATDA